MESGNLKNVEKKSKSVENKLASDQNIKKIFFHLIGPPNFIH
jgi:hypothetical protein